MMHRQLERMTTAYLILMLSLHVYGAFLPADERVLGKTRSDFIGVLRKHGERTTAVRLGSISALETATGEIPMHTAGDSPGTVTVEPGFIFREVTDGIETVQVVYDGNYVPKNCFVSADQPPVLELQDRVRQYAPQNLGTTARKASTAGKSGTKNPNIVTAPESLLPYLQYAHNASDYTLLVVPSTSVNLKLPSRLLRSMVSLDLIKSHCEGLLLNSSVVGNGRQRRSLLTYPKTLWCGKGTQATHFDQLGEEENTDRCCRAHDHCPHPQIAPMEKKLFLRNISPHTISDCRCDKAFHKCLKRARSPVAMGVGDVYFNRLKIKCFVTRQKRQCLEMTWFGSCLRREKTDTAVLRAARPFPDGKNLTKAEKALRRKRRRGSFELN